MLNRKTVAMTNTARQAGAGTVLQELTRSFYNGRTDAGHRYSSEAWLARYAEELLALMPCGGTLLDVGCGSCQITTYLAAAFDSVVGIDPSDSMLAAARERSRLQGADNISVLNGDAVCFP